MAGRPGDSTPACDEGAVVLFRFVDQPEGAAIAPSTSETDLNGRASVEVTLGRPAGDQPVDARLADPDHELRVRFLLTAIRSNSGGVDNGGNGGGGGDEEDGGGGKGKGKGKGHRGNGGNDDDNGGGDEDD